MTVPGKEKVFDFILRQNAENTNPVLRHCSPQLLLSRDIRSFFKESRIWLKTQWQSIVVSHFCVADV